MNRYLQPNLAEYLFIKNNKAKTMKIKYLKDAPLGKKGEVSDVPNMDAKILIKLGIAEKHTTTKRNSKKVADKNDSE